jgi:hypothetical protein
MRGQIPTTAPATSASTAATANVRRSSAAWPISGMLDGASCTKTRNIAMANSHPRPPPATASNRHSVSARRARRARPDPSADRTANSGLRAASRASIRFATLTHAIKSRLATAPSSSQAAREASLTR